jgi:tRNA (guanosine-2'-O-)-methyltransferase
MPTKARTSKVRKVLSGRFSDLRVVLEEVRNTHNASAVVRTCDAAGVQFLDIISAEKKPFPVNEAISTRAEKWLHLEYYQTTDQCLRAIQKEGFKIMATSLSPDSIPYTELDYTQPVAFVFGNESQGTSPDACEYADHLIQIPMKGMAQSLNLSVSVGIILYEVIRQRSKDRSYHQAGLDDTAFQAFMEKWLATKKKEDWKKSNPPSEME